MLHTNIWEIQNQNRIIFELDTIYKQLIRKICRDAMASFNGIPLTWEDIYNQFLFEASTIVKSFDPSKGVPFKTFLGKQCRFFVKNCCRSYCGNHYKVMNNYIAKGWESIDFADKNCNFNCDEYHFNELEMEVYENYVLGELTLKDTCEEMHISKYKVRKIIEGMKNKVIVKTKN